MGIATLSIRKQISFSIFLVYINNTPEPSNSFPDSAGTFDSGDVLIVDSEMSLTSLCSYLHSAGFLIRTLSPIIFSEDNHA